jgi:hypothetical protein
VAENKTPPTGTPAMPPPRPIPTLATVQTTVEVLVGQVKGLRADVASVSERVDALGERMTDPALAVLRFSKPPTLESIASPATSTPVPQSRPSMAAKAAKGTSKATKLLMIATGALSVAGQVVALWEPEYTGPIIQALRLLASLGGGHP